jgi:Leucine-rich repeat (LRR) protein
MTTREFIKKHYQPLLAGALLLVGLLVFGIIQLVNIGTSQAERLKNLGDRYYNSHNAERAIQHYEWALEADAGFEEVYFLLFDIYTKQGDRDRVRDVSLRGIEHIRAEHERFAEIYKAATDYVVEFVHHGNTFEQVIRPLIDKPEGDIWRSDLDTITVLDISNRNRRFSSLEDFIHFRNLESLSLSLSLNASIDFSDLTHMDKLTELHINRHGGSANVDIGALSALTGLEILTLRSCGIADLSPLSALINLHYLDIRGNGVVDLSPLVPLINLSYLDIRGNSVVDLSPLARLTALEYVDFRDNPLSLAMINDRSATAHIESVFGYPNQFAPEGSFFIDIFEEFGSTVANNLRQLLNLHSARYVLNTDLESIEYFELSSASYDNLDLLKYFKNLQHLHFYDCTIEDMSGLGELPKLSYLSMYRVSAGGGKPVDISGIENLVSLTNLDLFETDVLSFSPLSELKSLTSFSISRGNDNQQTHPGLNISGLEGLVSLESLNIYGYTIDSLSPLSGLKSLKHLYISIDHVQQSYPRLDISGLSGLVSLERLVIYGYTIDNLSPLRSLTALKELNMYRCLIGDLSPLANLVNLESLDLSNNGISNISALSGLTNLKYLSLQVNKITDVRPLASLTNLTRQKHEWTDELGQTHMYFQDFLWLYGNPITDFSSIRHIVGDLYDDYDYETWVWRAY